MAKSAERKRFGIYYTPPEFTSFIAENVVGAVVRARLDAVATDSGVAPDELGSNEPDAKRAAFWRQCLEAVREVKVVDPACGSGAFLIQAYDILESFYDDIVDHITYHEKQRSEKLEDQVPDMIVGDNLFGVDLSPQAVEITQLALWIRTARKNRTLTNLSKNIVCGNSLVTDKEVDPRGMVWEETFPQVFARASRGFDCVIGNPPWEWMKLQEREFFDVLVPAIANAVSAATRRNLIQELRDKNPAVYTAYEQRKTGAEMTLRHVRDCGRFPLTGKGDINTYAVFAELSLNIVAPKGRVGILVPSGIATDQTTSKFFGRLVDSAALVGLYDFENKGPIFPDVHRSYKFSILLFGGAETKAESADFVFFAHAMNDLDDRKRHIVLAAEDFKRLNPNSLTCPVFRSPRDAEITKAIYRRVPVLVENSRKEGGNPWGVRFLRMFDQTNDAEMFRTGEDLKAQGYRREGAFWKRGKKKFMPLYEAKMFRSYDHRFGSVYVKSENWMIQGQTRETTLVQHQNPGFTAEPRWWVDSEHVESVLKGVTAPAYIAYRDITRVTDSRTTIASFIPAVGVTNTAPIILAAASLSARLASCLLANLNSIPLDYVAKQKVGHMHLNFFILEQLPIVAPVGYSERCPWASRGTLEKWISDRVLKLTCTSNDMKPLAEATGLEPPVHRWNPTERREIISELDAAYFLLYGIDRDDAEYILGTFSGTARHDEQSGLFGSAEGVLEAYDRLATTDG